MSWLSKYNRVANRIKKAKYYNKPYDSINILYVIFIISYYYLKLLLGM